MIYFNIIIPTCERPDELHRAIESVKKQTFKKWTLIVCHDDSIKVKTVLPEIVDFDIDDSRVIHVYLKGKHGAGGARNAGIRMMPRDKGCYTLFLDDDDELTDENVLMNIAKFIEDKHNPDMIRMGYIKHFLNSGLKKLRLIGQEEADAFIAVKSKVVSPSSKAVKSELVRPFLENVKHQDVVQHIEQCDNCSSCAVYPGAFFIYNLYDRPDKNKESPECKKALELIPSVLRQLELNRKESKDAAEMWAIKIERMYG